MNTEDTARIVQDHLHCQEVYTGGEYEAMNCGLRLPEPHGDADFRACHIAEALHPATRMAQQTTIDTTPAVERMVYEWQYIKPDMPTLQIMETLIRAAINIDELARAAHADDLAHGRAAVAWEDMDDDAHAWYMDNARAIHTAILGCEGR